MNLLLIIFISQTIVALATAEGSLGESSLLNQDLLPPRIENPKPGGVTSAPDSPHPSIETPKSEGNATVKITSPPDLPPPSIETLKTEENATVKSITSPDLPSRTIESQKSKENATVKIISPPDLPPPSIETQKSDRNSTVDFPPRSIETLKSEENVLVKLPPPTEPPKSVDDTENSTKMRKAPRDWPSSTSKTIMYSTDTESDWSRTSTPPFYISSTQSTFESSTKNESSKGPSSIGRVVGILLGCLAAAGLIIFVWKVIVPRCLLKTYDVSQANNVEMGSTHRQSIRKSFHE